MGAVAKRKVGRPRLVDDDDDDDDLPPPPGVVPCRESWDNPGTAAQVRAVLDSFEDVPPIDDKVRQTLQRWLYRQDKYFGGGGAGHITAILRIFLESDTNRDALVEPILCAVAFAHGRFARHGLALLDAMDTIKLSELLETMRSLDIFSEESISTYMEIAIRNRIAKILEPVVPEPVKIKPPPKPPQSAARIPLIEKQISIGSELFAIRASIPGNTEFGRQVRKRFPGVDQNLASDCLRVARLYASRPQIWRALSWIALVELSSPKMSQSVRKALEVKVMAGESITAPQIRKARGRLKGGCLKRKAAQPVRMAA
jgi:hypothetical protein